MFLKNLKICLLISLIIIFFTSCGGGGSDSTTKTITTSTSLNTISSISSLTKLAPVLSNLSITNTEELSDNLKTKEPLALLLELKKLDNSIQSEDLLNLMKDLEKEILIKPLLQENKITKKAFNSLSFIDSSIQNLKSSTLRVWQSPKNSTLNTSANEEYIKQQWISYNNKLTAFGEEQLSLEDFKSLRTEINNIIPLFVNFGKPMQNVISSTNTTMTSYFAGKSIASMSINSTPILNTSVLNPVNEALGSQKKSPSVFLDFKPHQYMACNGLQREYPFQIMGTAYLGDFAGNPIYGNIDTSIPLLGDEHGKRFFQINETGLAELLLTNKSNQSITLELKHNDKILFTTTIEALKKQKVFIPVFEDDICVPYYITKDDDNINATIIGIKKPRKLEKVLDSKSGAYDIVATINTNEDQDLFLNSDLIEFSLLESNENQDKIISFIDNNSGYGVIQYIIKSPSGKLSSTLKVGTEDFSIKTQNGKWQIYVIPIVGAQFDEIKIDEYKNEITSLYVMKESSSVLANKEYKVSLRTSELSNRKKFIISEMKNAEFSHDGESLGNSAEVILSLHTNMAPKLDMGEDLNDLFNESPTYPAYKCWNDNGKTINLFDLNQACYELRDGLENIYYEFMKEEYGISKFLIKNNSLYSNLQFSSKNNEFKQSILIWKKAEIIKQINDAQFGLLFETYSDLYQEWENSIVQINDLKFPLDYHYGIQDSIIIVDNNNPLASTYDTFYHPSIPLNIPILALTKKRMASSTMPFGFKYSAYDNDEVDKGAIFFAVAKYIVNQTLAALSGNFSAFICNTFSTMGEVRDIQIAGEDDPIGEADFFLNRFSSNDQFYGLQNNNLNFSISGLADIPNHYTSADEVLGYANLACGILGTVSAGYDLYSSVGGIISGDFYNAADLDSLKSDMLDQVEVGSSEYNKITNTFDALKNGTADAASLAALEYAIKTEAFKSGIDIYNDLSNLNSGLGGLGSQGYNTMRSEANYYFSNFNDRKTRSDILVKEVESMPIVDTKVTLDNVYIIHNLEDGNAEVKLRTRVGVISDENPSYTGAFATNAPYMINGELLYTNGTNDYKTLPNLPFKGYLLKSKNFNGISDGEFLNIGTGLSLYEATYPSTNNTASIYLEVGLFEGDGGGVDDDMIGVLSKTFYLEDLFNNVEGKRWRHIGNNIYRLTISDYPVYDATGLATSVEIVNAQNREKQLAHNNTRIDNPSALISFHIDVQLGDFINNEIIDVQDEIVDGDPSNGKVPMDYSILNLKEISSLSGSEMKLHDVYGDKIVVLSDTDGIKIANIDQNKNLSWERIINSSNVEPSYKSLLEMSSTDFNNEKIKNISFIDSENLLMFRKADSDDTYGSLAIINTKVGNSTGVVTKHKTILTQEKPTYMVTQRVSNDKIRAFVILSNLNNNSGQIIVYDVTKDSIDIVSSQVLSHVPVDLLLIDNKTLLLKSEKLKYKAKTTSNTRSEYWIQEIYLTLYEFKDNNFTAKDLKQYTFNHQDYTPYTGIVNPAGSRNIYRMKNVNNSNLNRIVGVHISDYHDYNNNPAVRMLKLLYNGDTKNYRFGLKHNTRVGTRNYLENEQYPYFIDTRLKVYETDLNSKTLDSVDVSKIFGDNTYYQGKDMKFLDSKYLVTLGKLQRNINYDTLSIIDTQYVDNTPPIITSTDLDKEHIMEYSNNFTASINFKVSDVESLASDLNITFTEIDPDTDEEYYTGTDTSDINLLQRSKLTCDNSGNCNITVNLALHDSSIKTKFRINVEDHGIVTHKYFTTWLAKSEPVIYSHAPLDVTLKNEDTYNEVDFEIISQNEISNGYIDEFIIENKPDWLTSSVYIYGTKTLRLKGTPPIGSHGSYDIKVTAKNDRYEDVEHYVINVIKPDITPDIFSFPISNDVQREVTITKEFIVSGINGYAPISITNGEYKIDDNNWTNQSSVVTNTSKVTVRHTSSTEYSTETISTLTVGGITSQLISRTITDPNSGDFTPNPFTFVDATDVALSTQQYSQVTITGINEIVNLSITNGEYSFDKKQWFTNNTTVQNDQTIYIRHTSSNLYFTEVNTTLTVGGISDVFTSKTIQIPKPILTPIAPISVDIQDDLDFTPNNTGGEAGAWSIENKPEWVTFNTATGKLTGTATQAGYFSNIIITATNAGGTHSINIDISVDSKNPPYINSGNHTIDEEYMEFTFTDNQSWRDSITEITIQSDYGQASKTLVLNSDYTIETGKLTLIVNGTNNVPTKASNWQINIKATNYYDSNLQVYVQNGTINISHAQSTLNVSNAPLRQGKVSNIKFQAFDRFGNSMSSKEVYFDTVITNNNNTFDEPYFIKDINQTTYTNFINPSSTPTNRHSYYTDQDGWVEVNIKVPACVDINDGFEIVIKDTNETILMTSSALINSISLNSTTAICTDSDWTKRFVNANINKMKLITDLAGNIYVAGNTTGNIDGFTNLNGDIYLSKIDRNGVTKWQKLLGTSGYDLVNDLIIDDTNLYLAITTTGSLENNTNAGLKDAGLLKVSALDGSLTFAKQIGEVNDDLAIGISKSLNEINLYVDKNSESFLYKYDLNGTLISNKDLLQNLKKVIGDNENNHLSIANSGILKYDVNGDFLLSRSNTGGASYYSVGLFTLDTNSNNDIYTTGQTKLKLFDEEISDSSYYGTIVKRNKNGNYQWSKILGTESIITTGGNTTIDGITYVIYTQRSSSLNSSPRDMYMEVFNDKNGVTLGTYTWEAGNSAYNAITANDIISDANKHSLYIAANVIGTMTNTNIQDGLNVIIKKQQYDTPIPVTGYSRSSYLNIVTDYDNKVQWVDTSNFIYKKTYDNASDFCSNEVFLDDNNSNASWRVPTSSELDKIINSSNTPAIKSIFESTDLNTAYWSSTEKDTSNAYATYFWSNAGLDVYSKSSYLYVRCIRDNQ